MDITKQKAQTNEGILKGAERIFDEFAEILEKQVVSSPTENFIVDWKSKFKEFVSLVKRMREAQIEKDESDQGYRAIPHICILEKKDRLESEVDEYLKNMKEEKWH